MLPLRLRLLKRLDALAGRWMCANIAPAASGMGVNGTAALTQPPRPVPPAGVERILIIRPGGIGDAVLTFPMIAALRRHYREAEIEVLGERRNAGVYRINDWVRRVHLYDRHPLATMRELSRGRYQIVVDTEQYHYLSCIAANRLRPDYICGFDTIGRGRFQTHRVRYSDRVYEVHSFLSLASALIGSEQSFDPDAPFLEVSPQWVEWAEATLHPRGGRPVAVVMPTASTPHRFWPVQRYAEIAQWLARRGFLVVVLGGPDAGADAGLIEQACRGSDVLNLAGRTTLPQTAGILTRTQLYVSADTGPLHIAYGVGTPTVHMFGSGIQEKWAPQGRRYLVVNKNLPCSPCTRYGYTPPCPYHAACMDAITVADVTRAIDEVLADTP